MLPSLLELLQRLIERTYQMEPGIHDLPRFVVGDRGLRLLYAERQIVYQVGGGGDPAGEIPEAKVLVRRAAGGTYAVNIYYPDALIAMLERHNPLHGLTALNLDPFVVFVEELDHFLVLSDRARAGRPISLFELELHANVTKFLTCRHFLERTAARELTRSELRELGGLLFAQPRGEAAVRHRYHDADRYGYRFSLHIASLEPRTRLAAVRSFHQRGLAATVRVIEGLPTERAA